MHFLGLGLGKAFKVLTGISNLNYVTGCLHDNNVVVRYCTFLVRWNAGEVSLSIGDVIFAQLAHPLKGIIFVCTGRN